MTEDTSHKPKAYSQTLSAAIERMHQRRSEFLQSKIANGNVSLQTHARFEEAVLTMYYELRPYAANDSRTSDTWNRVEMDSLPNDCGKIVEKSETVHSGGITQSKSSVDIDHADPSRLLNVSRKMDEMSHSLGFTAAVDRQDPKDSPNMNDLRGLLIDRGQFDAADKIPGNSGDD